MNGLRFVGAFGTGEIRKLFKGGKEFLVDVCSIMQITVINTSLFASRWNTGDARIPSKIKDKQSTLIMHS